jgi:thiamine kinase-like enzyme
MTATIAWGQGATPDERKIEAVLEAFGLSGAGVSYRRLALGITNLNWLAHSGERTVFIKLFGDKTDSFINRQASGAASRIAGEMGVGPKLLASFEDPGAEIYEFLDGYRNIHTEDLLQRDVRKALMDSYRRMHGAPLISETRSAFTQLETRVALAREHGAVTPRDLEHLLWQCDRAKAAIARANPAVAVCHNDSYAANFMINDAGDVRVIDWEYAANNDPAWDLAMIAMGQFGAGQTAELVADYAGAPDPALAARVHLYGPVVCISWALWAALQSKVSSIPFDFRKYSKTLCQMGRAKLRDPAWEAALWTL